MRLCYFDKWSLINIVTKFHFASFSFHALRLLKKCRKKWMRWSLGNPTANKFSRISLEAVLRIHDILMWIRIRRSMPLTNGSGSGFGSCYFRHLPSRRQQKTNKKKFFCLLLFVGPFTSFFKDKKSNISHKTIGIKVFLLFLLDDRRIRIRIRTSE